MPCETIVDDHSAICLVGGAPIDHSAFSAVSVLTQTFVGVDSGADFLLRHNLVPAAVIGDLDSLSDRARAAFSAKLCEVAEQATTDFEKALLRVSAPLILALGFTGGRLDHMLAVLNTVARNAERAILLVDREDVSFLAPVGKTLLDLPVGTRISVMPIEAGPVVSMDGVAWAFQGKEMQANGFSSPSNAALGGEVTLETSKPVLVTLPLAQLEPAVKAAVRGK